MSRLSPTHQLLPKRKAQNPIEHAIAAWLGPIVAADAEIDAQQLLVHCPKRWVAYEPMVLLPAGSFSSPAWRTLLSSLAPEKTDELWRNILSGISKKSGSELTHLAVNEGIPLHTDDSAEENILRSPSGLHMLYGDFGASSDDLSTRDSGIAEDDFEKAFWVSTKQNGIRQTWAPRWTMFSRGNVTEKARLLEFHDTPTDGDLRRRRLTGAEIRGKWAVDLYAGIGYFVFSYAKLGMRVLCWEINPWSVEGLRRGAHMNGWSVKIVKGDELRMPVTTIMAGQERIVVFLEGNQKAARRLEDIRCSVGNLDILHVNCGFLPTSEPVWQDAWDMVQKSEVAWLHLHENVAVTDIPTRKAEIQQRFEDLTFTRENGLGRYVKVEHVEQVKTFAPGVWHCVFDLYTTGRSNHT